MNIRLQFMIGLYNGSQVLYTQLFKRKKKAWGISQAEILLYPEGTLGKTLGEFYRSNGFDIMPKLENHDVFHILTDTGTEIQDEIAMQYLLLGNGKFSFYLLAMLFIGTMLYPEFLRYYYSHYQKGKSWAEFHNKEFKYLLDKSTLFIQASIRSNTYLFI